MSAAEGKRCFGADASALLRRIHDAIAQPGTSHIESVRDEILRRKDETSSIVIAFSDIVQLRWGRLPGPRWRDFFDAADVEKQQQDRGGNRNERLKRTHLAKVEMYWPIEAVEHYRWSLLGHSKMQLLCHCAEKWKTWESLLPVINLVLMLRHRRAAMDGQRAPSRSDRRRQNPSKKSFVGRDLDLTIQDLKAIYSISHESQDVYGEAVTIASAVERSAEIDQWTNNMDGSVAINGHRLSDWRPRDWALFLLEKDGHGVLRQRRESDRPAPTPAPVGIVSPPPSVPRASRRAGQSPSSGQMVDPSSSASLRAHGTPSSDGSFDRDVRSATDLSSDWPSDRSTLIGSLSPKMVPRTQGAEFRGRTLFEPDSADEVSLVPALFGRQGLSDVVSDEVSDAGADVMSHRVMEESAEMMSDVVSNVMSGAMSDGTAGVISNDESRVEAARGSLGALPPDNRNDGREGIEGTSDPSDHAEQSRPPAATGRGGTTLERAKDRHAGDGAPALRRNMPAKDAEPMLGHIARSDVPAGISSARDTVDWGIPIRARSGIAAMAGHPYAGEGAQEHEHFSDRYDSESLRGPRDWHSDHFESDSDAGGDALATPQTARTPFSTYTPSASPDDSPRYPTRPGRPTTVASRVLTRHPHMSRPSRASARRAVPWWEEDSENDDDGGVSRSSFDADDFENDSHLGCDDPPTPRMVPRPFSPHTPSAWSPESSAGFSGSERCTASALTLPTLHPRPHRSERTSISGTSVRRVSGANAALQFALAGTSGPAASTSPRESFARSDSGELFVPTGPDRAASRAANGHFAHVGAGGRVLRIDCTRPASYDHVPPHTTMLTVDSTGQAPSDSGSDVRSPNIRPRNPTIAPPEDSRGSPSFQGHHAQLERHLAAAKGVALDQQAPAVCRDRWHWLDTAKPASIGIAGDPELRSCATETSPAADADVQVFGIAEFVQAANGAIDFAKPVLIRDDLEDGHVHEIGSLARGLSDRFGTAPVQIRRMRAPAAETVRTGDLADLLVSDDAQVLSLGLRDKVRAQMPAMTYLPRFDLLDVAMAHGVAPWSAADTRCARAVQGVRSLTVNHVDTSGAFRGPQIGAVGGTCLRVLAGTMLCIYVPREAMAGEWDAFGEHGPHWRPRGRQRMLTLQRNDQLLLPAGTVRAVYTMDACVAMEIPVWDSRDLVRALRCAHWAAAHPQCSSGAPVHEIPWVLDGLKGLVRRDVDRYVGTRGREEFWMCFEGCIGTLRQRIHPHGRPCGRAPQRRTASSPPSADTSRTQRRRVC